VLFLTFFRRNSAARAKTYGSQWPASWPLMVCTAASRCTVAKVDEDPRLGRLARCLLPSRCRCNPLHRCCRFSVLCMPPPVHLPGGVAGIVRRLLFKLPSGSPFGHHEPFYGGVLSSEFYQDFSDAVGDGPVCLLEDDGAHHPRSPLPAHRLEGADQGDLQ
jgi:hypothetical protein